MLKNAFLEKNQIFKILISIAILSAIFLSMDMSKFSLSLESIHFDAWLIALGLIYLQVLALSYRWLKLINVYERKISFGYALKVNVASLVANYLFITSIGGIIVRVYMSVKSGVSLARSIAATGLDRLFTLFTLIFLSICFLPIFSGIVSDDLYQKTVFFLLLTIAALGIFGLLLFEAPRKKIIFSHRKIAMCFQFLRTVLMNKKIFSEIMVASIIGQICYFAAALTIMNSMGIDFSLIHFAAVIPIITIFASLPIGYGGWGIREGAFVYGLGLIQIPLETAFLISVQIGIISIGGTLIACLPALVQNRTLKAFFSSDNPKKSP